MAADTAQPVFAKPAEVALLDVASSWISHYPQQFDGSEGRVALLGMNDCAPLRFPPLPTPPLEARCLSPNCCLSPLWLTTPPPPPPPPA
eukprot:COSAG04_NODE_2653_length_3785_cov_5.176614_4_plen_88_part_01